VLGRWLTLADGIPGGWTAFRLPVDLVQSHGGLVSPLVDRYSIVGQWRSADRLLRIWRPRSSGFFVRGALWFSAFFGASPKGAITSWVEVPPGQWSVGPVAGRRCGWVTGRIEALRQTSPWAAEQIDGP